MLNEIGKKKIWFHFLFQELGYIFIASTIICDDNQSAIILAKNLKF